MTEEDIRQSDVYKAKLRKANCSAMSIATVLLAGWVFAFLSWFTALGFDVTLSSWFGRSGAVLTIASLLAAISIGSIKMDLIGEGGMGCLFTTQVFKDTSNMRLWITCVANASAVAGTIVWGYGDLMHA